MKILVLHGPNLNMLGIRDQNLYGSISLNGINALIRKKASDLNIEVKIVQTNHEGMLIDIIQSESKSVDGILINPGAFTHYSYAIRDALQDSKLPIVEVHLSDITTREAFRKTDVLDGIVVDRIMGLKEESYLVGLEKLVHFIIKKLP